MRYAAFSISVICCTSKRHRSQCDASNLYNTRAERMACQHKFPLLRCNPPSSTRPDSNSQGSNRRPQLKPPHAIYPSISPQSMQIRRFRRRQGKDRKPPCKYAAQRKGFRHAQVQHLSISFAVPCIISHQAALRKTPSRKQKQPPNHSHPTPD